MAIRNIKYHTKSACNSMVQNVPMTLASILTVACCLFLFGIFLLFSLNISYLGEQIQGQCEIQAFMREDISDEDAQAVYQKVKGLDNVKEATFESKTQAMENYKAQLGVDASVLDGLDEENFMRNSVKITMNDLKQADSLVNELKNLNGVDDVKNRKDITDKVLSITDGVKNGSFIIMIILTVVSLFIISNTIKLSVFNRANEIHIMKFVGATDWYIRWPFVIEGMIVGLIGGVLAILALFGGYVSLLKSMESFMDLFKIYTFKEIGLVLCSSVFSFGVVMGSLGSGIAIRRHLKV